MNKTIFFLLSITTINIFAAEKMDPLSEIISSNNRVTIKTDPNKRLGVILEHMYYNNQTTLSVLNKTSATIIVGFIDHKSKYNEMTIPYNPDYDDSSDDEYSYPLTKKSRL